MAVAAAERCLEGFGTRPVQSERHHCFRSLQDIGIPVGSMIGAV
jgi:hypothetical protein